MKKAIMYSITSAMLIGFFVVISSMLSDTQIPQSQLSVTQVRVEQLSEIMQDMQTMYFDAIARAVIKNSLVGLSRFESDYHELDRELHVLVNDTSHDGRLYLSSTSYDLLATSCTGGPCMDDLTQQSLRDILNTTFAQVGIDMQQMDFQVRRIEQHDPWMISANFTYTYILKDKSNTAIWEGKYNNKINISILGLTHPLNHHIINSSWVVDPDIRLPVSYFLKNYRYYSGYGVCRLGQDFNCDGVVT